MKNLSMRSICYIAAACAVFFAAAGCRAKKINDPEKVPVKVTAISVFGAEQEGHPATKIPEESAGWTYETIPSGDLPEKGSINGLDYKIIPSKAEGSSAEKGFYVFGTSDGDRPYKILVAAGKFNTGGYDINITGIKFNGTSLVINVKETSPAPAAVVTQAFTYPCCAVEVSKLPDEIKVIGDNGYEYQRLFTRLDKTEIKDGWIAYFADGCGELMYRTYVYETGDGRYKYVNVNEHTSSWGSSKWEQSVSGTGIVNTREEIAEVAKKHGSYGYVMFPGDNNKPHAVSEFIANKPG